jgi:hypothetical protein
MLNILILSCLIGGIYSQCRALRAADYMKGLSANFLLYLSRHRFLIMKIVMSTTMSKDVLCKYYSPVKTQPEHHF